MAPDRTTGRDPPQRREARFAKRRCPLHPGGLLPGCQERRPRRDKGGATVPVAANPRFCVRDGSPSGRRQLRWLRSRQPPRQGDARKSHKQEKKGRNRKNNNSNKHSNHRNITSGKNIPDTSQTGREAGDAPAWPASLPAGASLPGVFARADRWPPPPALVSPVSAALKVIHYLFSPSSACNTTSIASRSSLTNASPSPPFSLPTAYRRFISLPASAITFSSIAAGTVT